MALPAPALAAPAPDTRSFRDALGRFATGVALVTAAPNGEPVGLIVNSLTSVSLDPPLVSFCPSRSSLAWSRMRRTRRFGVNVLGRQHEEFAVRATPAGADRFTGLDWELGRGEVPLLTDALASLETWFVLHELLGHDDVKNYDGSWTELGQPGRRANREGRGVILKQYDLGCPAHASYLVADEGSAVAAVVDPQRDVDASHRVRFTAAGNGDRPAPPASGSAVVGALSG